MSGNNGIYIIGTHTAKISELERTEEGHLVLRHLIPQDATIVGFTFIDPFFVTVQFTLPTTRRRNG